MNKKETAEYHKKWREKHPEYHKKWRENNADKVIEYNRKAHLIHNPRRLKFKGRHILLKENPRKGVCSKCGVKVGNGINHTQTHHFAEYDIKDPLKNTMELCPHCHAIESLKLGQLTGLKRKKGVLNKDGE